MRRRTRRIRKRIIAHHAQNGRCTSIGPITKTICQKRTGHVLAGDEIHRAEDYLDPIIIKQWVNPRLGERYI